MADGRHLEKSKNGHISAQIGEIWHCDTYLL